MAGFLGINVAVSKIPKKIEVQITTFFWGGVLKKEN